MKTTNGLPAKDVWWTFQVRGELALGCGTPEGDESPPPLPDRLAAWPPGSTPVAANVRPLSWSVRFEGLPVDVRDARR